MKDKTKSFIVFIIIGLVITALVIYAKWNLEQPISQRLCDGFFVAGVLLVGMGGLKYVRNQGFFDMASYSIVSVLHTAIPSMKMNSSLAEDEDLVAYKERKKEERKPAGDILWAGGVYIALAVIMLVIYQLTV